jgi:hypothetical protein
MGAIAMNAKGYVFLAAAGAVVAYLVYRQVTKGVQAVVDAVNPLSDKNAAYSATNAVGAAVTGNKDFSLGSAIYDWFNPEYDPNAPADPVKLQTRPQAISDQFYNRGYLQ